MFVELFAGTARLSQAVNRFLDTRPDDALTMGGTNFLDPIAIEALKKRCAEIVEDGRLLFFHVAPPCSTFSRARDRGARTRLRTPASPQGIQPNERRTEEGNRIARATADLVTYLATELDAREYWEQPCGSYMLPFLDGEGALDQIERSAVILHQCRFGAPYQKPTTFCFSEDCNCPRWTADAQSTSLAAASFTCSWGSVIILHRQRRSIRGSCVLRMQLTCTKTFSAEP